MNYSSILLKKKQILSNFGWSHFLVTLNFWECGKCGIFRILRNLWNFLEIFMVFDENFKILKKNQRFLSKIAKKLENLQNSKKNFQKIFPHLPKEKPPILKKSIIWRHRKLNRFFPWHPKIFHTNCCFIKLNNLEKNSRFQTWLSFSK